MTIRSLIKCVAGNWILRWPSGKLLCADEDFSFFHCVARPALLMCCCLAAARRLPRLDARHAAAAAQIVTLSSLVLLIILSL